MSSLLRVAVNAPLFKELTYSQGQFEALSRGTSVEIPLGKRKVSGVVLGLSSDSVDSAKIKEIQAIDPERPALREPYIRWAEWLSRYYVHPVGQVFELFFPPLKKVGRKSGKKFEPVRLVSKERPTLTAEQQDVVNVISAHTGFGVHLLFGITGSGKTEVYLHLIEQVLEKGQSAIVLVPEIALTPQLLSRFMDRLGDTVSVIHSHLTDREKTDQWWSAVEGRKSVLIGARSALFCPVKNLGMIVLDEEHENSFKQDEKLRYHARDAAIMLGRELDIPVVLGSATPSLESWQNVKSGKFQIHKLTSRATKMPLPSIKVLDMREPKAANQDDKQGEKCASWASPTLLSEISSCLSRGEQAAVFLNRRGVAHSVICPGCGFKEECPNCSISLTLHGKTSLVCHYCDYQKSRPEICPKCKEFELKPLGLGTERIEADLQSLFPDKTVLRADRDEIQSRAQLEELIQDLESGKGHILIGTQMIAKGLDFPMLTLVGVAMADVAFNLPDFRAAERSFQLLSQVSGRAGRSRPGTVLVQTYNPDHPSVVFARNHDYEGFVEQELQMREDLGYPPFGRLVLFKFSGLHRNVVEGCADNFARSLEQVLTRSKSSSVPEILGPAEAPIFRLRNQYRYHLLLKCSRSFDHSGLAQRMIVWFAEQGASGVKLSVDIDPLNML